jgi:pilus assembly protein CpaF
MFGKRENTSIAGQEPSPQTAVVGPTAPVRVAPLLKSAPDLPTGTRLAPKAALDPKLKALVGRVAQPEANDMSDRRNRALAPTIVAEVVDPRSKSYLDTKAAVTEDLFKTIDIAKMSTTDENVVRDEIRAVIAQIVGIKGLSVSVSEQERLVVDIAHDLLGYGPLQPLLMRDDITDIMVNGPDRVFIEVDGITRLTNVKFRDNAELMNICQRIVSAVGRRVDESSPMCDARLPDGSRVNVILPPLGLNGPTLTIRKFKKQKLTLRHLVDFGAISPDGARVLSIVGLSRCNVIVSGGTGSGKTTLLNTLTAFIDAKERIVTCEDTAELQLQQPHVVSLETRPKNLEGQGEVTMQDLIKNCLRMRPDRIIVGEVRGPEAFDLLQAMNTGHDGSMGTLHANSPREALARLESMINMGYGLSTKTVREMIVGSVNIVVQVARLRDGSRRITHITEVLGMEGDMITLQDLFVYNIEGEDAEGRLLGTHRSTGIIKPKMWERARYYNAHNQLQKALEDKTLV